MMLSAHANVYPLPQQQSKQQCLELRIGICLSSQSQCGVQDNKICEADNESCTGWSPIRVIPMDAPLPELGGAGGGV